MEFAGDLGLWQRKIAEGIAGNARRAAVLGVPGATVG
jgi:hypothetical protein